MCLDAPFTSPNFQFLAKRSPRMHRLAAQAESYCFTEPDLCLTRLRQVIECLASQAVVLSGQFDRGERPDLPSMIRELESRPPDMQGFASVQQAPISANGESTITLPRIDSSYFRLSRQP